MIRGADAQFKFNIPCTCDELDYVTISFWQKENNGPSKDRPLPIIKVLPQCFKDSDNRLSVVLDREETLRFSDKRKANVQLRATMKNGVTFASKPQIITVYPIHDESLLDDLVIPSPKHDYVFLDGQNILNESDDGITIINAGKVE